MKITAKRNVKFYAFYSGPSAEDVDFAQFQSLNQFDWLTEQGFEVVEHHHEVTSGHGGSGSYVNFQKKLRKMISRRTDLC